MRLYSALGIYDVGAFSAEDYFHMERFDVLDSGSLDIARFFAVSVREFGNALFRK
jgi:hypothetical protein